MSRFLYSVVIPSFKRSDSLSQVLAALCSQVKAPEFEVVIVDDNSKDGTLEWLRRVSVPFRLSVFLSSGKGPAAARNLGVEKSKGERVIFLGDDTVPSRRWLYYHHKRWIECGAYSNVAVLGYTKWHRRISKTPFLEYINEFGLQFGYSLIKDFDAVPFNFFYTSNVSIDKELVLKEKFDERFPYPAWEDIDLAYRLSKKHNLRILYTPLAIVEHDHPTDLKRFAKRQFYAGKAAVYFAKLHPELALFVGVGERLPRVNKIKKFVTYVLALFLQRFRFGRKVWDDVLNEFYKEGLYHGREEFKG